VKEEEEMEERDEGEVEEGREERWRCATKERKEERGDERERE
jgi:hypothetical protein